MQNAVFFGILCSLGCVIGTGCATTDAERHRFSAADYGLAFLEPEKASAELSGAVTDKVKDVVDFADQRLEPALATVPAPAPQIIKLAVTAAKPILLSAVQEQLKTQIDAHPDEVKNVLVHYNKVFQDEELAFTLPKPVGDAASTVARVNDTLTRPYRTLRAVRVAHKLLAVAKIDAQRLKAAPDVPSLVGVGVAALSVADLSLHAIEDAQSLGPELQGLGAELTNTMTGNPLLAADLAGPAAQVTGAQNDLIALPADAAALLSDVKDLLALFQTG